ncbi:hypothetical protein OF001_U80030 [Pseudomonas sp. OF001]|nr:hypothetical protein OF001_U80030 [Pseudomonas sp. OF001]
MPRAGAQAGAHGRDPRLRRHRRPAAGLPRPVAAGAGGAVQPERACRAEGLRGLHARLPAGARVPPDQRHLRLQPAHALPRHGALPGTDRGLAGQSRAAHRQAGRPPRAGHGEEPRAHAGLRSGTAAVMPDGCSPATMGRRQAFDRTGIFSASRG